jgi:hypothetical protein
MASMMRLWAASPRWRIAEGFLNPFFAGASDTAFVHCARPKPYGRYPLALTVTICRMRSHVAKKSFNQLLPGLSDSGGIVMEKVAGTGL